MVLAALLHDLLGFLLADHLHGGLCSDLCQYRIGVGEQIPDSLRTHQKLLPELLHNLDVVIKGIGHIMEINISFPFLI